MVTTADILGRVHRPRPLPYIPTRFPHTYAFDMLREHPEIVPLAVIERIDAHTVLNDLEPIEVGRMSRGDASTVCRVWAEWEGQDRIELDTALAYAYIDLHDIDITEEENSG